MPSVEEKVQILRDLTRGPDDVFALRGMTGWQPVYSTVTDEHLKMHMAGAIEVGSYALLPPEPGQLPKVWWIAADFDGKRPGSDWKTDVTRSVQFLMDSGANVFVNLSRSAEGAHVRVLFAEPVPAWMARLWMGAYLVEAEVMAPEQGELDRDLPTSFDRMIPPQDLLPHGTNPLARTAGEVRYIGNLIGSPLNRARAEKNGGTMPIDASAVANGDFDVDGHHWDHALRALRDRKWDEAQLMKELREAPGVDESRIKPPPPIRLAAPLPIINDSAPLTFTLRHCEFMRMMSRPGLQPYELWVAVATHLHRFGDQGHAAFHEISARDPRYRPHEADRKWQQTEIMNPVRCSTLAQWGWRCPHLDTPRCGGAWNPAVFYDCAHVELL